MGKRFVDDTFTIITKSHKDPFLEHINSIDHNIQFMCEEPRDDGSIPFLDMLIMAPKDKDPILKKVESFIDINVTGWCVIPK